jgi:hypothetical protein
MSIIQKILVNFFFHLVLKVGSWYLLSFCSTNEKAGSQKQSPWPVTSPLACCCSSWIIPPEDNYYFKNNLHFLRREEAAAGESLGGYFVCRSKVTASHRWALGIVTAESNGYIFLVKHPLKNWNGYIITVTCPPKKLKRLHRSRYLSPPKIATDPSFS